MNDAWKRLTIDGCEVMVKPEKGKTFITVMSSPGVKRLGLTINDKRRNDLLVTTVIIYNCPYYHTTQEMTAILNHVLSSEDKPVQVCDLQGEPIDVNYLTKLGTIANDHGTDLQVKYAKVSMIPPSLAKNNTKKLGRPKRPKQTGPKPPNIIKTINIFHGLQESSKMVTLQITYALNNKEEAAQVLCSKDHKIGYVLEQVAKELKVNPTRLYATTKGKQVLTTADTTTVDELGLKNDDCLTLQPGFVRDYPPTSQQNANAYPPRKLVTTTTSRLRPAVTIQTSKYNPNLKWERSTNQVGNVIKVTSPKGTPLTFDIFDWRGQHNLKQPFVRLTCPESLTVHDVYLILLEAYNIGYNNNHLFTNEGKLLLPNDATPISKVVSPGAMVHLNYATQKVWLPVTQTNNIPKAAPKFPQLYQTQQVIPKSNPKVVPNVGFNITELRDELQRMTVDFLNQQAYLEKMRAKPQKNVVITPLHPNQIIPKGYTHNTKFKTPYNQYQTYLTTVTSRPQNAIYNLQHNNALNVNTGKIHNVVFKDDYGGKCVILANTKDPLWQVIYRLIQEGHLDVPGNFKLYYGCEQIGGDKMKKTIGEYLKNNNAEIRVDGAKIINKPNNILNMGNNNPGYQNQINNAHPVNFPIYNQPYNQNNNQYVNRNLLMPKYVPLPPPEPKVNPRRIHHPKGKITIFYKTTDGKIEKKWDFDKDTKRTLGDLKKQIEEAGGNPEIIWFKGNRINMAFTSTPLGKIFIKPKIYILGGVAREKAIQQPNNINNLQFGNRLFNINPKYNQKRLNNKQSKRNLKKIYTIDR